MRFRSLSLVFAAGAVLLSCSQKKEPILAPDEARAIAKDAYIYGFPLVDNYRIQYSYFVDVNGKEYKGGWNEVHNTARLYTPDDKAIQSPNSDTPYSTVGVDLRAEPVVLTLPAVEAGRYYSAQFIDLDTYNFAYAGSRTTGNGGGNFLLAGPEWKGEAPANITQVIRCETDLALILIRTQLFGPDDLAKVKLIQDGYKVHTLSAFANTKAPAPAPDIDFVTPLSATEEKSSLEFFNELNFILQYCPTDSSETALMARFAKIGVGAGKKFDVATLSPEVKAAIEAGIKDAWAEHAKIKDKLATGELGSGDLVGTRSFLGGNYLYRMVAAVEGIYGNSKDEAMYPVYFVDSSGAPLDGTGGKYTITFPKEQLPPVNAFWSLTMYDLPGHLLVANPLDRYLINSPMLPKLKKEKDGSIILHIQYASPGPKLQANWLPAPQGPFFMAMRLYWPKPEALDGTWQKPALNRI
ncbi:MAG TPA: DUF1254 domain-containing protein [Candidatus Krumholzibacteria bacterium]|nr:DUF1254 domain-containing protein [Candidatus Krumholzibacteria bacterium]